jgi:hypothetical protein
MTRELTFDVNDVFDAYREAVEGGALGKGRRRPTCEF